MGVYLLDVARGLNILELELEPEALLELDKVLEIELEALLELDELKPL